MGQLRLYLMPFRVQPSLVIISRMDITRFVACLRRRVPSVIRSCPTGTDGLSYSMVDGINL